MNKPTLEEVKERIEKLKYPEYDINPILKKPVIFKEYLPLKPLKSPEEQEKIDNIMGNIREVRESARIQDWLKEQIDIFYKDATDKPTIEQAIDSQYFTEYLMSLDSFFNNEGAKNLKFASDRLKNDKQMVLLAVNRNGFALEFASTELKNDKEVVLAAIKSFDNRIPNPDALQYASDEIKNNKEIVLEAMKRHKGVLQYASTDLQQELKEEVVVSPSIKEAVISKLTKFRDNCENLVTNQKNKM